MISTKIGTQSFSKAVQNHNFGDDPNVHYAPATKTEVPPGQGGANGGAQKNVGDILNQVANPGGKDPNKVVRRAHNTLDKDDFLKLMLTQMKNQDPMNPMQSHEMAAQLAQFTSLEQLFNVNKNLEGLQKGQDPVQKYEALNFLGKSIKADTRQIFREAGEKPTELRFNLGDAASKVKVTISDEMGGAVKVLEFGGLKKGDNRVMWAGTNDKDQDVKPGKYTFNVEAENSAGHKLAVLTETKGTITGVNYSAEGPILLVGEQKVRLADVQKIEDDSLKNRQEVPLQSGSGAGPGAGLAPNAVPQEVLDNLTSKVNGAQNNGAAASNGAATVDTGAPSSAKPRTVVGPDGRQMDFYEFPKPINEASRKTKVKPEDKPEAKLTGAVLPLEVASANASGAGRIGGSGINMGGAFSRK